jgi:fructose-1,6-bisphosphatase
MKNDKSNAKLYTPANGAFTLAAKRLNISRQYAHICWNVGKPMKVIDAVIQASKDIIAQKNEERRQYIDAMRRAAQLTEEVNQAAEAAQ